MTAIESWRQVVQKWRLNTWGRTGRVLLFLVSDESNYIQFIVYFLKVFLSVFAVCDRISGSMAQLTGISKQEINGGQRNHCSKSSRWLRTSTKQMQSAKISVRIIPKYCTISAKPVDDISRHKHIMWHYRHINSLSHHRFELLRGKHRISIVYNVQPYS